MEESYDMRLKTPFTMQVVGSTGCGKTWWTRNVVNCSDVMMYPPPEQKIWAYGEYQDIFETMPDVKFIHGLSEKDVSREALGGKRTLLIIDDLIEDIDSKLIGSLFSRLSHHRSLSIMFLFQVIIFDVYIV